MRWGGYQGWYCLHANAQLYVLLTRGVTDGSVSVQAVENRAHSACSQSIQPLWGKTASWAWKSGCQQSRGRAFTQANVVGCHVKLGETRRMGLKIHQRKQPHAGLWSGIMAGRGEEQPQFGKLKNVRWPEPLTPDHFKLAGIRERGN